ILDRFRGDEVLVLNDTKVVPARLAGQKPSGGAVEVLFIEPWSDGIIALTRGTRLKPGSVIALPGGARAEFVERLPDGAARLTLAGVDDLWGWLQDNGQLPLPPYIERAPDDVDAARYQTVFAEKPGAVAAPTAGLHFTPALLQALQAKGVAIHKVTLHVGPGTFAPVRVEDVATHQMHSERFEVPAATWAAVTGARPVVAVGTTVVRALEAQARHPGEGRTDLFIYPGFEFQVVDGLLTNFHLPKSTLLMLVSAFAGRERVLAAYAHAVAERMRFFSYGDASLWSREDGRWT
ncbi:MAG: tRNA preQ1(34) S-adenosylmethionine ribosyltransferase-isomerase QueA, partial [Myxococcales bacterium]|nr:tRNA preQ1(34) S-adenosylmethionine ribosyltransferase-isomerase QueA [Myxococcales bacterium]